LGESCIQTGGPGGTGTLVWQIARLFQALGAISALRSAVSAWSASPRMPETAFSLAAART
jgi:hypothetical protein